MSDFEDDSAHSPPPRRIANDDNDDDAYGAVGGKAPAGGVPFSAEESDDEAEFEDLSTMDRQQAPPSPPARARGRKGDAGGISDGHDDHDHAPAPKSDGFERDLFGETSDEDAEAEEELFGKEEELPGERMDEDGDLQEQALFGEESGAEDEDLYAPAVEENNYTDMPMIPAEDDIYLIDLPNIIKVDPRPFDPDLYEGVDTDDEHELRLSVENTIRWRYVARDAEEGAQVDPLALQPQANARVVTWSDGSQSLLVGDELFELVPAPAPPNQYVAAIYHKDNIVVPERTLAKKMLIRPYSIATKSHQKMASMLADKFRRTHRTKMVHLERDPEKVRAEQLKAEQERVRAQKKLEARKRAVAARYNAQDALDGYEEEDLALAAGGDGRRGRGNGAGDRGAALGREEDDDLDDFVVDDDEEIVQYDEEDEAEELRRTERLMSTRRSGGGGSNGGGGTDEDAMQSLHEGRRQDKQQMGSRDTDFGSPNGDEDDMDAKMDFDDEDAPEPSHVVRRSRHLTVVSDEEE